MTSSITALPGEGALSAFRKTTVRRVGRAGQARSSTSPRKRQAKWIYTLFIALLAIPTLVNANCPAPTDDFGVPVYKFSDGSIGIVSDLAVNPDGTAASYTPGDSGFTYIVNGVNLYVNGKQLSCQDEERECRRKFLEAEKRDFGPGTAEFCSYAIEVAAPNGPIKCGNGRYLFGNGKGKPRIGSPVENVQGQLSQTYASMTALRHTIAGQRVYLDSMKVPTVVVGGNFPSMVGHVVWVRSVAHGRSLLAIAGDVGGKFGEASISVHQLLRYGELKAQRSGPIPLEVRCTDVETALQPPFTSRPDINGDRCRNGYMAKAPSDIRAYEGISTQIEMIFLGKAQYDRTGNVIGVEVTESSLKQIASNNGYNDTRIQALAACLK